MREFAKTPGIVLGVYRDRSRCDRVVPVAGSSIHAFAELLTMLLSRTALVDDPFSALQR